MRCADHLLPASVIAEGRARDLDSAAECGIRYHAVFPDDLEYLIAGDHAITVFDQEAQQREHLRFQLQRRISVKQLQPPGAKRVIADFEFHARMLTASGRV